MIKDPNKLTLKQSRFVDYYLQTGNATQSAKLAGYNSNKAVLSTTTCKQATQQKAPSLPDIRQTITPYAT